MPILFALFQSLYLTRRTLCEARFAFYIGLVYVRRLDDDPNLDQTRQFFGIEIKGVAVEIARLSLLIAEFQCDARLIGQKEAWRNVLPSHKTGQIHVDNALRLDWFKMRPPAYTDGAQPTDLFDTERDQFRGERGGDLYLRKSAV